MERGHIVEVRIEDMSSEGQGIGRADGLVIFVPHTVVGDVARVRLTRVKKRFAFSKLEEILEPSETRTDMEPCSGRANGCGGCSFFPMEYQAQLAVKENQIREKLRRLAEIDEPPLAPIIGMEENDNDGMGCFRYRNKAGFPVSTGGIITRKGGIVENLGEPAVGFYRAKSHEVVDAPECYLQSGAAMAAAAALRQFMIEDNITGWDPRWEKGLMKQLIVKTGFHTGEVMVILTINGKGIPNMQKLAEMLDDAIYEAGYSLESIVLRNLKGEDTVAAGKNVIRDQIGDLSFEISPASFYQVNPVQTERLYNKVREYCGFAAKDGAQASGDVGAAGESEIVGTVGGDGELGISQAAGSAEGFQSAGEKPVILDLYCGVGTIGLYCADEAEQVVGIEIVKDAVLDANRNAVVNGIVNARYICGKAEEILPLYAGQGAAAHKADKSKNSKENKGDKASEPGTDASLKVDPQLAEAVKRAKIAILDPPRAGCRPELLEAVIALGVERIVYVSCDPATLARDIKFLGERGYALQEATPVDMFPHTAEVETVVLLSKVQN